MSKIRLHVELDAATNEWIVVEHSRYGEAIRGRYATENEAFVRMKTLEPPSQPALAVEDITDEARTLGPPLMFHRITVLFNGPQNSWLVLGWINRNPDPEILERCKTEFQAKQTARGLRKRLAL